MVAIATIAVSLVAAPTTGAGAVTPQLTWHHATRPDPFRGDPTAVDCVRRNWCMVVDESGQAVRYHDGHWDRPVRIEWAADVNGLKTVSCGSPHLCVALDAAGRLTRFNGSSWTPPHEVAPRVSLDSVSCPNATFCMALGSRVARWNGVSWHISRNPMPRDRRWTGLSCTSRAFCMATFRRSSTGANVAWTYTAHVWRFGTRLHRDQDYELLSCTSRMFCMAVGGGFRYARWDGASWRYADIEADIGGTATALSCSQSNHCVLASTIFQSKSAEWNGRTWGRSRDLHTRPTEMIAGLSCVGAGPRCLAVDKMGGVAWYASHHWHRTVNRDPGWGIPGDVGCGASWCIVEDDPGGYVRTSGSGWSRPRRSLPNGDFAGRGESSVSCTSDTFCLVLAVNGTARAYDGTDWHTVARAPITGAVVSCVSAHWCAALDLNYGHFAVFNGSAWHKPGLGLGERGEPWTLACGSRTLCVASTALGYARVFNGSRWLPPKRIGPKYQTWNAESCVSASFCMVGGGWGTTWRYDGSSWHRIPLDGGEDSISCTSATFCAGIGSAQVHVFNGRTWTLSATLHDPEYFPYQRIGCASRSLCVITSPANPVVTGTGA